MSVSISLKTTVLFSIFAAKLIKKKLDDARLNRQMESV